MLIIYTGNGKGKTSACVGQAIRVHGNNMNVCFGQFMKSDQHTGEQEFLKKLLKDDFFIGGKGFFTNEEQRPVHRQAALEVIDFAKKKHSKADMLILDECLYALQAELIFKEEVLELIDLYKDKHLVLSGRGLTEWLKDAADIVSEVAEIKHASKSGTPATKGIEF